MAPRFAALSLAPVGRIPVIPIQDARTGVHVEHGDVKLMPLAALQP